MITAKDIILALSNSGETGEIISILPVVRRIGVPVIAICGQAKSTLGQNADIYLDASVDKEACPLGLAPTASTTAALALGDALAVALLSMRKFTPEDFALFHPGGSLGKKLLLTVENIMRTGTDIPLITADKTVKEALFIITAKGLGATLVVDSLENAKIAGLVTDGDIRRGLERGHEFLDKPVSELMSKKTKDNYQR